MTTETKTFEPRGTAVLETLSNHQLLVLRQQVVEVATQVDADLSPLRREGLPPEEYDRRAALLEAKAACAVQLARLKRVLAERGCHQPGQARRWADVVADLLAELDHLDLRGEDNKRLREVRDEARRMTLRDRRRDQDHMRRASR